MDTIKISSWSKSFTLTVGDDVVVVTNPGRDFGVIPRFGRRRRGKVTRVLGRAASPYVEVDLGGEKMLFDDRGDERGKKYNSADVKPYDASEEATVAAEAKRAEEARKIVADLCEALPHASQIEKLVWMRPDLVPVLRELLEKIGSSTATATTATAAKES